MCVHCPLCLQGSAGTGGAAKRPRISSTDDNGSPDIPTLAKDGQV